MNHVITLGDVSIVVGGLAVLVAVPTVIWWLIVRSAPGGNPFL